MPSADFYAVLRNKKGVERKVGCRFGNFPLTGDKTTDEANAVDAYKILHRFDKSGDEIVSAEYIGEAPAEANKSIEAFTSVRIPHPGSNQPIIDPNLRREAAKKDAETPTEEVDTGGTIGEPAPPPEPPPLPQEVTQAHK